MTPNNQPQSDPAAADEPQAEQAQTGPERREMASSLADEAARKAIVLADSLAVVLDQLSDRLTQQGNLLTEQGELLEKLSVYGRRSRRIQIGLVISFAVDIILTIILSITAFNNSANTSALHAENIASCEHGNEFRADQNEIWERFVAILSVPAPGETEQKIAETKIAADAFLQYVHTVNAPTNCAALYGK